MNRNLDQEQEYVASLYEHYADALFRFAYFKTSQKEVALDIVQETFVKTWDYLSKGNEVENVKAFLYKVAGNLVIDHHRKKKSVSLEYLFESGMDIDSGDTGHQSAEARIEFERVKSAMNALSARERELVLMRHMEDMPVAEIADVLGERPNTVSVALHRAMEKLRTLLEQKI